MRLRDGRGRPGRDEEDTRNEHYVLTPQYPSASSSFVCWPGQAVVAGRSTERTSTQRGRYRCRRAGVDHARPIGPNFIPRAVRHALRKSNARLLGRWPGQREWGRLADCDAIRYSDATTSHCRHHGRRLVRIFVAYLVLPLWNGLPHGQEIFQYPRRLWSLQDNIYYILLVHTTNFFYL
jgi:hypothetical protein